MANGLNECTYGVLILPDPIPEKMDVTKVKVLNTKPIVTPEQEAFCNNIKEEIGEELFNNTAEILRSCRNDWDFLRPFSRAFLIKRMIGNDYETGVCCLYKYLCGACSCAKKPNRLCCYKEREACDEVHGLFKPYDYMSFNKELDVPETVVTNRQESKKSL